MVWGRVPHPPAGATTLIVSLGILRTPSELAVLMLAVALLTAQGFLINRAAGIDYPRWAPKKGP
jgi:CBS-domain-containing membrane protein